MRKLLPSKPLIINIVEANFSDKCQDMPNKQNYASFTGNT